MPRSASDGQYPDHLTGERTPLQEAELFVEHKNKQMVLDRISGCLTVEQAQAFVGYMNRNDCMDQDVLNAVQERVQELREARE